MLLTPNGRWEVGKPICLSASSHHQESWDPNWNLRTLVMALRNHMITQPNEIGSILTTAETQRVLAKTSTFWICPICGAQHGFLDGRVSLVLPPLRTTSRSRSKKVKVVKSRSLLQKLLPSVGAMSSHVAKLLLLVLLLVQAVKVFVIL
jgi:hypothetical protein